MWANKMLASIPIGEYRDIYLMAWLLFFMKRGHGNNFPRQCISGGRLHSS